MCHIITELDVILAILEYCILCVKSILFVIGQVEDS
jgi:hypothetical protein